MAWVCRVCRWSSLAPRRSTTSFMSRRSFNTNSNLSLLLKNYMIPTIRVEQDVQAVARNLERKVGLAPLFYQNAPVILDFEASEGALESNKIVALFNDIYKLNLIPVGITFTNDPIIQDLAKQYSIPFINSTRPTAVRSFPKDEPHSRSPLPPSSHTSSPMPLNSPQKPEKMLIRTFSNSIQAEALRSPAPPFHTPLDHQGSPTTPPIQLATSPGPPPPLHHSPISSTPISPSFSSSGSSPPRSSSPASTNSDNTSSESVPPLIIKSSLRSGQQVYARNGADLIVMGSVHSGAEALADGNIHIYGSLKGRALAGVSGNLEAKIFSEEISIADTYCACEEQPPGTDPNKPSVVWLEQGNLKFSTMD